MDRVTFLSRHIAEGLRPPPDSVLVSIRDRSEPPVHPQLGWKDALYLRFHDSDGSHLGLEQFSIEQATSLIHFVQRHIECYELVIHCQMGVSRSAAVGLFFATVLGVPCYKGVEPVSPLYNRHNQRVLKLLWEALESEACAEFRSLVGV